MYTGDFQFTRPDPTQALVHHLCLPSICLNMQRTQEFSLQPFNPGQEEEKTEVINGKQINLEI